MNEQKTGSTPTASTATLEQRVSRLNHALDAVRDAVYVLECVRDEAGNLVDFNLADANAVARARLHWLGHEGVSKSLLQAAHHQVRAADFEAAKQALRDERALSKSFEVRGSDGRERSFRHDLHPHGDTVVVVSQDISDIRAAGETLRAVQSLCNLDVDAFDLSIRHLLREAQALLGVDRTTLWQLNPAQTRATRVACCGCEHDAQGTCPVPRELEGDFGAYFVRLQRDVALTDRDIEVDARTPLTRAWCAPECAFLQVPVLVPDQEQAILSFEDQRANRFWSPRDLERAHYVAELVRAAYLLRTKSLEARARTGLMQELFAAQDAERARLARELHDGVGQNLTSALAHLGIAKDNHDTAAIHGAIESARSFVLEGMDQMSRLVRALAPSPLERLGLGSALQQLLSDFERAHHIHVDCVDCVERALDMLPRLPRNVELAAYRVVQEALTNVARHSRATSVGVVIELTQDSLRLIVEDNGVGLPVEDAASNTADRRTGFGLTSMRERVTSLGGEFTIESDAANGTTIFARIPVDATGEDARHDTQAP